jgi:hypothetical protein
MPKRPAALVTSVCRAAVHNHRAWGLAPSTLIDGRIVRMDEVAVRSWRTDAKAVGDKLADLPLGSNALNGGGLGRSVSMNPGGGSSISNLTSQPPYCGGCEVRF